MMKPLFNSLIETAGNAYDPFHKNEIDNEFIELQKLLVDYPGDLLAIVQKLKTEYDLLFNIGMPVYHRYLSVKIDIETYKSETEQLRIDLQKLDKTLMFNEGLIER